MRHAERGSGTRLDGRALRVAIVQARFNATLTDRLAAVCIDELLALGVGREAITEVAVPGALEIGVALAVLAEAGKHDALIAIGCVIRGETYHFELVANESGAAVTQVGLRHRIAIANAILTCDSVTQAEARVDEKGRDAARVAVEMAHTLRELA